MNVKYVLFPIGTVMIYVECSETPSRMQEEEDIAVVMAFLGRVEELLYHLLSDTRASL